MDGHAHRVPSPSDDWAEDLAGLFIVWVIAVGLTGFSGNELVASYRIREGRRIGSMALVADGQHARTVGLTSLGVGGGRHRRGPGVRPGGPTPGLAIAVVIVYVLWQAGRSVLHRNLDGTDESTVVMLESVAHHREV